MMLLQVPYIRNLLSWLNICCNGKNILSWRYFFWLVLVLMHITVPLMFVALHLISFVAMQKYRIYYYCIKTNEICIRLFDLCFRVIVDLLEWNCGWRPQKLIIHLKVNFFFKRHYSYRKSFIVTFMCNKSAYIPFVRSTNY